jgi:hypothetical protein
MTSPEEMIGDLFGDPGLLHVTAEVWAVAADEAGLWLVSPGGPWASLPIVRGDGPHDAAIRELQTRGLYRRGMLVHQSSSRTDGPAQVTTWMALVPGREPVPARFPDARPVSPVLAEIAGPPPTHAPDELPVFALWHVLAHGLRELWRLGQTNATLRRAMDEQSPSLREHLGSSAWQDVFRTMYAQEHQEPGDVEMAVRAAWHAAQGAGGG